MSSSEIFIPEPTNISEIAFIILGFFRKLTRASKGTQYKLVTSRSGTFTQCEMHVVNRIL